jgi:hypothetical protein
MSRTLLHRNSRGTTFKLHSQFLFADARNKPEAVERWGQGFSEADRITEQKDVDRQEDERKPKKQRYGCFPWSWGRTPNATRRDLVI